MKGLIMMQLSEQQICTCVSVSIFCIVRKTRPILPMLVGSVNFYGRVTGRPAHEIRVGFKTFFKIIYRLNYSGFILFNITAMLLQYYRTAFQWAFIK